MGLEKYLGEVRVAFFGKSGELLRIREYIFRVPKTKTGYI
jgi:hypothetical protein